MSGCSARVFLDVRDGDPLDSQLTYNSLGTLCLRDARPFLHVSALRTPIYLSSSPTEAALVVISHHWHLRQGVGRGSALILPFQDIQCVSWQRDTQNRVMNEVIGIQ